MKKILYFILSIIFCLSCTDQAESLISSETGQNGKVKIDFSVVVPESQSASRALTKEPGIRNLYLAVFDQAGYLLEYVQAEENTTVNATQNNVSCAYSAELPSTSFPTTIHFIANGPESLSFGSETEVIGSLSTALSNTNTDDASYWQKVYLEEGIKIDENDELIASVQTLLTDVVLVRNFAWIQLSIDSSVDNFILDSYCVVNVYDKGSIAPYNTNLSKFQDYLSKNTHAALVGDGYNAFIPKDAALDKNIPDESKWTTVSSSAETGYFIYERENPKSNPIYILMRGTYSGMSGYRYYKIDLRDNNEKYFPVLRNYKYKVNVVGVTHSGHDNKEVAAQGSGSGDVSTSMDTESYSNISNGKVRLDVSFTDITLVPSNDQTITLKYKFQSLVFNTGENNRYNDPVNGTTGNIEVSTETGNVISSYNIAGSDAEDGWRTITITPATTITSTQTETMTIVGNVTINGVSYSLQRKIKFTLRPIENFQLVCEPNSIAESLGAPFDLVIKIPGGLGKSMFPLDFDIEAVAQSITPDKGDNLPVVTRESIVTEGKTTMGFIKTISWSDYESVTNVGGMKSFLCNFKSNRAVSATTIYAQNKYFVLEAPATLDNYTPDVFTNLAFNSNIIPGTVGSAVSFGFNMAVLPTQGNVTVTLEGLEPVDDNILVYIGSTQDGKNQYNYVPTGPGNQSFELRTTVSIGGNASVKLEAYHFTANDKTATVGQYVIPANRINVGTTNYMSSSQMDFSLYTANPGKTNATAFHTFKAKRSGSNPSEIVISESNYNNIQNNTIYIRLYRSNSYYVAAISLVDLENGMITLTNNDWKRQ